MNGTLGLNARTLGVSRDMIMSAVMQIGGRYLLVQDDPALAAQAAAVGLRVVYRQSGDETLSLDPAAFVAERAKNAPAAAFIHLTNELDPTPELLAWTMEAMRYANTINRKLCIFNYSTHRTVAQWGYSRNVAAEASRQGHAVGCHVYSRRMDGDPGALSYAALRRQVGGNWLVTEFGYALDAYHGWRGSLSQQQYADFCRAWLPTFAAEGMPALLFSFDHWTHNEEGKAHGFGVNDAPELLKALATINVQYPIVEQPTVPPTPIGTPVPMRVTATAGLKLRAVPNGTPVLYTMPFNTAVTGYPDTRQHAGDYDWIQVNDDGTLGWAATTYLKADAPPPAFRLKNPVGCAHVISSKFGVPRDYDGDGIFDDTHEGVDVTRAHGDCTPLILNGHDGVVMDVSSVGAYGVHVIVSSVVGGQEWRTWYCHLARTFVGKGQALKAGDAIGIMGSTGNSTGVHLHLSVQKVGAPTPIGSSLASVIDPEPLIVWG